MVQVFPPFEPQSLICRYCLFLVMTSILYEVMLVPFLLGGLQERVMSLHLTLTATGGMGPGLLFTRQETVFDQAPAPQAFQART